MAHGPVHTAELFVPLHGELVALLESLAPGDWERPTVAGSWRVRDVVAHLVDTDLRRVSAQRDGHHGPPPDPPVASYRDLVAFLNALNRQWVQASERLSPQVLLEMARASGAACARVLADADPMAPALYPVVWAGETRSLMWMDVGRDYTEKWHHQQQIRDAVGAPLLLQARWTRTLFQLSVRALPRAYSGVEAPAGTAVQLDIGGPGGGSWHLTCDGTEWMLMEGVAEAPAATVHLTPDQAWRLLYNALPPEGLPDLSITGDSGLAGPLLAARSVMV